MLDNKLTNIIGVVAVIVVIVIAFEFLKKKTETRLYSDEALKELENSDNLNLLNNALKEYHKSGFWDEKFLNA